LCKAFGGKKLLVTFEFDTKCAVRKKFATNLILLLALNLIVKPVWIFGIDRTVQNMVGASEYGLFFALFNFSFLLNIFLDFGLTNYNNREISRHAQLLPRYLSNLMGIKFLMAIVYFLLCFGFGLALGYSGRQLWLLGFLAFNQFLSSLILYFRSNISALQMFKTDSLLSVTDRLLMILFTALLIWGPVREGFKIEWFVYSQTLSYAVAAIIGFSIVYYQSSTFRMRFDRVFFYSMLKQSYPYALLVLLMSVYSRIDTVMLERLLPDGDVQSGIYAQAFRLLDAANMVPFLFASLLLPMFSKMIKQNESVRPLLGLAFNLLTVSSFTFAVTCFIYRNPIMDLLYVHHPSESSAILGILMFTFIFISVTYIFGTLLTANGNLRHLNVVSCFGVLLNIGLNLLLIPKYHAVGAAFSSVITQFTMALLQVLLTFRVFKIVLEAKKAAAFVLFIIVGVLLAIFSTYVFSVWYVGFVFSLGTIVVFAFIFRIFTFSDILMFLLKGNKS